MVYRVPSQLVEYAVQNYDPTSAIGPIPLHGVQARVLSHVPGNEILQLQVARKTLRLSTLPAELSGLTITHLSDLHFTGEIGREYYDYVADQAITLKSDVVILSGDIIESVACKPWIQQTLGRLKAPLGKYYVLGNHDKRMPDVPHVRRLLGEAGFVDLGGRCEHVEWRGSQVLLAGNERPWFPGPDDAALTAEASADRSSFRLLVSHSPDQFAWARRRRFDLMLAGHNHGGQVCFPFFGPLVAPSLYGTRYAGGLYFEPPTLLHVSRGISGEHPIRIRCLPELVQLVLRSAQE
jgi:predicted MPP superfamily phosphohydrolase